MNKFSPYTYSVQSKFSPYANNTSYKFDVVTITARLLVCMYFPSTHATGYTWLCCIPKPCD